MPAPSRRIFDFLLGISFYWRRRPKPWIGLHQSAGFSASILADAYCLLPLTNWYTVEGSAALSMIVHSSKRQINTQSLSSEKYPILIAAYLHTHKIIRHTYLAPWVLTLKPSSLPMSPSSRLGTWEMFSGRWIPRTTMLPPPSCRGKPWMTLLRQWWAYIVCRIAQRDDGEELLKPDMPKEVRSIIRKADAIIITLLQFSLSMFLSHDGIIEM